MVSPFDRVSNKRAGTTVPNGFVHYICYGQILAGHAAARLGDRTAVEAMLRALEERLAGGAALARPYHLALIADAAARSGEPARSVDLLTQATDIADRTGEIWCKPMIEGTLHDLLV